MKQAVATFTFRIPFDLHQFIAAEAERNMRTLNNQLLVWVKEKKEESENRKAA